MRIIHAAYTEYPIPCVGYGGVETGINLMASYQAQMGHDVVVFANGNSEIEGCEVVDCGNTGSIAEGKRQFRLIRKVCKKFKPDLVHDHTPWGFLGERELGVPVLRTIYGDPAKRLKHTIRDDVVLSFTSKAFASFYGYPDAKVIRMAVGDNLYDYPYSQLPFREKWFLFVGKMEEIKGAHLSILISKMCGRSLLLVGPRTDPSYFNRIIKPKCSRVFDSPIDAADFLKFATSGRVVYGGVASKNQLKELYLRARAVLVTSDCEEAMSRVPQEAMLQGCPVLAVNRGGIPESCDCVEGARICETIEDFVGADLTLNTWHDALTARNHILTTRSPLILYNSLMEIYSGICH